MDWSTHPPWVVELEACRRLGLVGLSTCKASQAAVALHHCGVISMLVLGHEVIVGISYFATRLLVQLSNTVKKRSLTLSQASIPRLVFFPPFCISLSFPTDTALNAKNCGTWVRAVQRGQLGRSTYAGHDSIRQQSLEGDTHGCESVSGSCGSVGEGLVRCDSCE